jgi:NAD(P)-dependent dehydrogenase (short-subunit alcohol dehydrogenase family)
MLRERTCVVTNADSVVGRAIATSLASAGATVYEADANGAVDVDGLARDLLAREGGIDFVVHGAATSAPQEAEVRAACQLTQALLPGLLQNRGQVVVVSSMVALTATTAPPALSNSVRRAVNPHGVPVVSVYAPARLARPEDVASVVVGALGGENAAR